MRVIIQRSLASQVSVDQNVIGQIDSGLVLLVGFCHEDQLEDLAYCVRKICQMRLFEDHEGKMNLSIRDVEGQILSISQFTLFANTAKGNRPSFTQAARFDQAKIWYDQFNQMLRAEGLEVATGQFGGDMQVQITNQGPVTIILDSKQK
ncbi:D-aminoacyl-tRNA deacylase [Vaginisenegalia massiliensis]|uniref:D-aminoacyl-tRNA deacylase n=1 Tax=Vaginisenegalia massiliensis TaxID=2058294 RepID=UPI000F540DC8|nr:D-aminoacyl-tRNA deacylase [Vaginisenegalia massiliensis]